MRIHPVLSDSQEKVRQAEHLIWRLGKGSRKSPVVCTFRFSVSQRRYESKEIELMCSFLAFRLS